MGGSWAVLGPSWAVLGRLWGPLGPSWGGLGGLLGRLGAVLGASWTVLERRKAEKARRQKTLEKQMKINDLGLLGPSREASWSSLGVSWGPLGPALEASWAVLRAFRASWDPILVIGGVLGASGNRPGGPEQPWRVGAAGPEPPREGSRRPGAAMESRGSWPGPPVPVSRYIYIYIYI